VFAEKYPDWEFYNTDGDIGHYIERAQEWATRHHLQELLTGAAASLKEGTPHSTLNRMQAILAQIGRDTGNVKDIDLIGNAGERIENLRERVTMKASGKKLVGIPSGINELDEKFGGWQRGDFIVLAGWTGSLKSWLALKFAQTAWLEGYRVLYFSLEMSGLQIGYRFDTLLSGMMGEEFTVSGLTHAENITFDQYKHWLGEVTRDKHPFVVVTNEDLDEVSQNTVQSKIEHWKPDLVVLDYHGLFDDASGSLGETEKAKNLSKAFKRLAIKTGVPIIDITGVTMPQGDHGSRPPELHEMAWTKQLAYDSDLTLALCNHPGELGSSHLEVVSRKSRRSPEIKFRLDWDVNTGVVSERPKGFTDVFAHNQEDDDE
jgi:replicative DNA helicase